jgi:hypothetical protein
MATSARQTRWRSALLISALLFCTAQDEPESQATRPNRASSWIRGDIALKNAASATETRNIERQLSRMKPTVTLNSRVVATAPGVAPQTENATAVSDGNDENAPASQATGAMGSAARPAATAPAESAAVADNRLRPGIVQYAPILKRDEARVASAIVAKPEVKAILDTPQAGIVPIPAVVSQLDTANTALTLVPYVLLQEPLSFDANRGTFTGAILVGVSELVTGRPVRKLSAPILFQIVGATASPNPVTIDETSPPYKAEITISLRSADGTSDVRIVSPFDQDGTPIPIRLQANLSIDAVRPAVEGLGLEATDLNLTLVGSAAAAGRTISLTATGGAYVQPSRVRLDADGTATASLRSLGLGTATVNATTPGLPPARTTVRFNFPLITLLAAVLGGVAGGGIRLLLGGGGKGALRRLAGTALFGIVVFVAYAVGVNLLPYRPTVTVGAALVFAVAALGALVGTSLIDRRNPPQA